MACIAQLVDSFPDDACDRIAERATAYATGAKANRAVVVFNAKPKKGLALALEDELCVEEPRSIALFLLHMPGLEKEKIGEFLGCPDELNVASLHEYVDAIGRPHFPTLGFDDALRIFLAGFRLPGEAAPIERCMEAFAQTFTAAQPSLFEKEDTPFLLAYSTIMLNTDLHNPSQRNKMSKLEFISRTRSAASDR
jgi:Sec7-like guanine-nucleotide exchange factor